MNRLIYLLTCFSIILVGEANVSAQLLNKLKEKAEDKIVEKIFEGDEYNASTENNSGPSEVNDNRAETSKSNTKGGGLSKTKINVETTIASAEKSFTENDFSRARSAVRDAIMAIELEIGENILTSLPENVEGLSKDADRDKVTTTGIGFVGLTIERVYEDPEKELKFTVANNSGLYSTLNMYLASGGYATSEEQDFKKVDFKGYNSIIEYDDYKGYTLSVPFGQSSIVIINGINYSNEEAFMESANKFDIEKIKTELGEK